MDELLNILNQYRDLNIAASTDFDKFNGYAITHHSTAIEGSTLTLTDTRLLLDEGITPKGKPLLHSLMVKDHYDALLFTLHAAEEKAIITKEFIQQLNAHVMKNTGSIFNTPLGQVDGTKGEFRKGNVRAGGTYFINYDKVIPYTDKLSRKLQENIKEVSGMNEILELSFAAQYDLVSIHPFYDGNGRTSRLLMNYIQQLFNYPLAMVFVEDKKEYIEALASTDKEKKMEIFYNFMYGQYKKMLSTEIQNYQQGVNLKPRNSRNKGLSMFF